MNLGAPCRFWGASDAGLQPLRQRAKEKRGLLDRGQGRDRGEGDGAKMSSPPKTLWRL